MTHRLFRPGVSTRHLVNCVLLISGLLGYGQASAQQTLDTQVLSVTSVCAGSSIDVTGVRSFLNGDFAVELSNGGSTYTEIPSSLLSASGRYEITYRAIIPANTPAGSNYRVRMVSKNPVVLGTPSPTILTVKAKPSPPTVDAVQYACQVSGNSDRSRDYFYTINVKQKESGAVLNWSRVDGNDICKTLLNYSGDPDRYNSPLLVSYSCYKPGESYKFFVSQAQDFGGCESDKATTELVIRPAPTSLPPSLSIGACQGEPAIDLTKRLVAPNGFQYQYLKDNVVLTTPPPIIETNQTTAVEYIIRIFSNDGCFGPFVGIPQRLSIAEGKVTVTINPRPGKPTVPANSITLCQSQATSPLVATADSSASLVWYGTDATGGTGSSAPPQLSTANAGTVKYYVAQKRGDCESDRAEITVEIKPTPNAPSVQSVVVCQNASVPALQATGQNLLWYTGNTGGTGTATAPVVSTSQTTQSTYYVSQTVNGCESPRSGVSVTVNSVPGVPVVANTGPAYCQNAQAATLSATGQGLNWYRESSGGTSLGNTITPETKDPGNFTYYVSQTVSGCEGSRSSLTVNITAVPPAPTVTSTYSYCQGVQASALMATGNGIYWYEPSGNRTNAVPIPSTSTPGTVSYFVTQTANNCESARSEIKVTVKPTPGAPNTQALSVCQNEPTRALSANGQSLLWYSTEMGGTGSATTPTLNTSQAGQTNYYVSQTLDGCESARATLAITIKSLPPAPGVTTKNVCQFAAPEPVSAMGDRLTWYNTDGTKVGAVPIINTDKGGSFSLLVTQTVNDCEGPKATLTVNVQTTPVPTVARTIVEVCQGATSQPLNATGTSLKWTDPNGNVTTTAPTPPTLNATIKPEGDVYYVTQTGTNGCESPKVAIRVFVQTPPTLSIAGTTTTNLGLEVPLKLTFMGVGPYQYKLSNGLSGTAIKDTMILVLPERTTIYQVVEVANKCGTGLPGNGATATITVMIPTIQTLAFTSTTLCAGTSLTANFLTSGAFNPGSAFKLQLAKVETDSTKINFIDALSSQNANGQIVGTIPRNTPSGLYWVRVLATNPKIPIKGTNSPTLLTIRSLPTATLAGNQTIYEGQPASLSVSFTGDGPWTFSYRDSTANGLGAVSTLSAIANAQGFEVRPSKTTAYLLTGVSNVCGSGTLINRVVVINVAPLLSIEDPSLADAVEVYPVPATTALTVRIKGISATEPAWLEVTDLTGRTTSRQETRQPVSSLLLDQHPAGIYILHIRVGDRTASKRIVKL